MVHLCPTMSGASCRGWIFWKHLHSHVGRLVLAVGWDAHLSCVPGRGKRHPGGYGGEGAAVWVGGQGGLCGRVGSSVSSEQASLSARTRCPLFGISPWSSLCDGHPLGFKPGWAPPRGLLREVRITLVMRPLALTLR